MTSESIQYLAALHKEIDHFFSFDEIKTLCFDLGVDHENIPGEIRSAFIRNLIVSLARQNRLQVLLDRVREERPSVAWPDIPADFELPEAIAQENIQQVVNYHLFGPGSTAVYQGLTVEEVATLVVELKNKDQPTVWNGRIPYLGLTAFQESDAQYFFGRESLVDDLLERVQKASFIVIAGPSGSGKSSVARAGLFHALRDGRLPKSDQWRLATMLPGSQPLEQLALAIERLTHTPGSGSHIRQYGMQNRLALHEQVQTILSDDPSQRFVLLVDQFEETFTQTKDEAVQVAFIELLTAAAQAADGRANILLAIRSDFISHCARYPELRELMSQQFQLVGAMEAHGLAKAITLPALEVGAEIDPALVSQIMADMKGEPGALPLMSFALRDLFEVEKTEKGQPMDLTLPEYRKRGGIERALERHANHVFASFSQEQQELAKTVFSRLIEIGQGRVDTRRTAVFTELIPAGKNAEEVTQVIDTLAREGARLLTTSGGHDDETDTPTETTVTIAHEKLIDAWPWLRQLVDENRDAIALQNQIASDAQAWAKDRDAGYLYRSGRLAQVEEKLAQLEPSLNGLSQQFLEASLVEQAREQRQMRIQRLSLIGILLLLLTGSFIATLAFRQQSEASQSIAAVADANAEIANLQSTKASEAQGTAEGEKNARSEIEAAALAFAQNSQKLLSISDAQRIAAEQTRDILILTANPNQPPTPVPIQTSSPTPNFNATATAQFQELLELQTAATAAAAPVAISQMAPTNVSRNAVILDVPYRSQWDSDANLYSADGNATALAMLLNTTGVDITPNGIYDFLPPKSASDFITNAELIAASRANGITLSAYRPENAPVALSELQAFIDAGKPFIALVKYEPWKGFTGNNFNWGHHSLVVGYDEQSIYIHDPLFGLWAPRSRGAYLQMPIDLFMAGWGGFEVTENPNYSALVPDNPIASRLILNTAIPTATPVP